MNGLIVLVLLLVIGAPVCAVLWLINRANDAHNRIDALTRRLTKLEDEVLRLGRTATPSVTAETPTIQPAQAPVAAPPPIPKPEPVAVPSPPLPPQPRIVIPEMPKPIPAPAKLAAAIDWEQFMGVKLFAWLGGLALFLGVAFFVKYSFDNNLVPPQLRAALGYLIGLGLVAGGIVLSRRNYPALSQTLCGTGVVILYAVTFACHSIYHFPWFGPVPSFLIMALVTTAALVLAIRLNAMVVAILGMLGGFLAPILLSTGQDNPLGLFGYIAILDAGLILAALQRRWHFLTALSALATLFMQIGWTAEFFVAGKYFDGNKIFIALAVLLGFEILYLIAHAWAKRRWQINDWLSGAGLGLAVAALAFSGWFLTFESLAARPTVMFSFIFIVDSAIAGLVLANPKIISAQSFAGIAVFGLLGVWTANSLHPELLNTALAFYFVFAVWHTAFPPLMKRRFGFTSPLWADQVFPALALFLVLIPLFKFDETSFVVWPYILVIDLLAIGFAVLLGSVISVVAVLLLSLAATGALIFKIPATLEGVPLSFSLLGVFAVLFVAASVWLLRKLKPATKAGEDLTIQLPVLSAVLPFVLLIMASLRLPLTNPTPLFGLGLLLVILLLGVAKFMSIELLPAVGLICMAAVEWAWHVTRFTPDHAAVPLVWYLVFFAVFAIFPFLFLRQFARKTIPWATAAMAGVPQFFLVYRLAKAAYPNPCMGLLPAAFAIPSLFSLAIVLRKIPASLPARINHLAWFGGVALFFITLIFPVQFERQWITIGWALEGAALLWLFHRVPHPGLRLVGAGLLMAAFVRLALNPAVLDYHLRSAMPILNWYLYTYGAVTACLFTGAWLVAPPRNLIGKINAPPILAGLGTVLAFLLLNIEIADYFSAPGSTLTFQFSGNFARDMTYSIAWAMFALGLLVAGIVKKIPATRYAGLGLLSVTLLKLFFHDLAQLGQLYRICAFISVAIIVMLASFAYQRFFTAARAAR